MMKDYVASWKTNPNKSIAYLDMAKLKQDPTCMNTCKDSDITDGEKFKYADENNVVDSVVSSGANTVKVYVHDKTAATSSEIGKGGYE